jgi:sorbitol-specific phosphotransferase system component IIC
MSTSPHSPAFDAAIASWSEPLVEFFPRTAQPGERFFWRSQAEADSVARQKAAMLARAHQEALSGAQR